MKLYRLRDECVATEIIKRHGFILTNPEESLVTKMVWQKSGQKFKFAGWENTPKTALMAENPKYIELTEI